MEAPRYWLTQRERLHFRGEKCPECGMLTFPIRDIGRCGHRIYTVRDAAMERVRKLKDIPPIKGADACWIEFIEAIIERDKAQANDLEKNCD